MIARILVAFAILWAAVPVAHAGADKRAAAAHFQRGRALFEAGSYAAALDAFSAGYEVYPLLGFLVNIGQCQRKLDRLDDAAASFQRFLDSDAADPRLRAEVQEAIAEIAAERERRVAADIEARRQRDEAERRHPLEEAPPRRADLRVRTSAAASLVAPAPAPTVEKPEKKSRRWVWALVGVLAAGAAVSAVTVAVVETQQPQPAAMPQAGSLGLLDGRR
jgi:tetratricopeptide (TPR) repeat protein